MEFELPIAINTHVIGAVLGSRARPKGDEFELAIATELGSWIKIDCNKSSEYHN